MVLLVRGHWTLTPCRRPQTSLRTQSQIGPDRLTRSPSRSTRSSPRFRMAKDMAVRRRGERGVFACAIVACALIAACGEVAPGGDDFGDVAPELIASICAGAAGLPCSDDDSCADAYSPELEWPDTRCRHDLVPWLECLSSVGPECSAAGAVQSPLECMLLGQTYRICTLAYAGCSGGGGGNEEWWSWSSDCGDFAASCEGPEIGPSVGQCTKGQEAGRTFPVAECPPSAAAVFGECG